ncbi:hypothetical protein GCM10027432_06100 [Lysobacter fragariae]
MAVCVLLCSSTAFAAPRTRVVAWGGEVDDTMLFIPYSLDDAVAVAVPYVLRANGDVLQIGTMPPVVRASNAKAIAAAWGCLVVLSRAGTVAVLGDASCPTAVPAGLSGVMAIDTNGSFVMALTSAGRVVAWGDNRTGQTDVPPGLRNVTAIAAGRSHALALRSDGQVVAWGAGTDGELDLPAGLTNVVAIDAGGVYNQALKSDGSVVAWGDIYESPRPAPLGLPRAAALGAGEWRRAAVVLRDGTIREWGFLEGKALPSGLDRVKKLSMGYVVNYALVAAPISPAEAIADMRVDFNWLVAIEDADRSALNSYLDTAAWAVAAHRIPLACDAMRLFSARAAAPDVFFYYPGRVTYFVAQADDVLRLMRCR